MSQSPSPRTKTLELMQPLRDDVCPTANYVEQFDVSVAPQEGEMSSRGAGSTARRVPKSSHVRDDLLLHGMGRDSSDSVTRPK